jgi:hypothetical protein
VLQRKAIIICFFDDNAIVARPFGYNGGWAAHFVKQLIF